jgi:hypothetical protein
MIEEKVWEDFVGLGDAHCEVECCDSHCWVGDYGGHIAGKAQDYFQALAGGGRGELTETGGGFANPDDSRGDGWNGLVFAPFFGAPSDEDFTESELCALPSFDRWKRDSIQSGTADVEVGAPRDREIADEERYYSGDTRNPLLGFSDLEIGTDSTGDKSAPSDRTSEATECVVLFCEQD